MYLYLRVGDLKLLKNASRYSILHSKFIRGGEISHITGYGGRNLFVVNQIDISLDTTYKLGVISHPAPSRDCF